MKSYFETVRSYYFKITAFNKNKKFIGIQCVQFKKKNESNIENI